MKKMKVALIGASNSTGQEIFKIMAERSFPATEVVALDFSANAGGEISYGEDDVLPILDCARFDFAGTNLVFLAHSGKEAVEASAKALSAGAKIIDLCSSFSMDGDVPMIVPEVNGDQIETMRKGIVACPYGPTVPLALILKPLHQAAQIKRVVVNAYHAVSDHGREAMDELFTQTRAIFVNDPLVKECFTKQIAFNIIPQVGSFREDGETEEEWRLVLQTKKIVDPKIKISASAVLVPVFLGHCLSVNIECENEMGADQARAILKKTKGVSVVDQRHEEGVVTPIECLGEDNVFVGRIRDDMSLENGINLWIVADSLRKCAGLNAVQTAEMMVKKGLI